MTGVMATVFGSNEDLEITSLCHRHLGYLVKVVSGICMILVKDIGRQ